MARKRNRNAKAYVNGYAENLKSGLLLTEEAKDLFYKMIEDEPTIYVLYNGKKIYYIGQSKDGKGRIKHHYNHKGFALINPLYPKAYAFGIYVNVI